MESQLQFGMGNLRIMMVGGERVREGDAVIIHGVMNR